MKRSNASLTADELKAKKLAKKEAKTKHKLLKLQNRAPRGLPPHHLHDALKKKAEVLTQSIAQSIFHSAPPSTSTLSAGNNLLSAMTKKALIPSLLTPESVFGYSRAKLSTRMMLTYNSLRMLASPSPPTTAPQFLSAFSSVTHLISYGAGPNPDLLGALIFLHLHFALPVNHLTLTSSDLFSSSWRPITSIIDSVLNSSIAWDPSTLSLNTSPPHPKHPLHLDNAITYTSTDITLTSPPTDSHPTLSIFSYLLHEIPSLTKYDFLSKLHSNAPPKSLILILEPNPSCLFTVLELLKSPQHLFLDSSNFDDALAMSQFRTGPAVLLIMK